MLKSLYVTISLFVFLIPFQTVLLLREPIIGGEKWQYGTIGVYVTDILLFIALLFFVFESLQLSAMRLPRFRRLKLAMTKNWQNWLFLFFFLWAGFSIFWASDRLLAGYMFVKLLLAGGVFFLAWRMIRAGKERWIALAIIVAVLLQAIIGIGQFVTQETFSSTLLGTSTHESWQAGTSVLKNESGRWLRAYGTLPHPNMYGLFLAVGLLFVLSELTRSSYGNGSEQGRSHKSPLIPLSERGSEIGSSRPTVSTPLTFSKGSTRYSGGGISSLVRGKMHLLLASIPLLLLGLVLSFSRLAWMGFVFGLLVLVVYRIWRGGRRDRRLLLVPISVLFFSGAIFTGLLHETVFPRFDSAVVTHERSVVDRISTYREGREIVRKYPWLGVGAGNYTAELIRAYPDRPVWSIQPAHDVPLLVLTELGIPGFILFLLLGASILVRALRRKNTLALVMFLALLPSLLLDHFLWTSHFGIVLLILLLGYTFSSQNMENAEKLEIKSEKSK